MIVYSNTPTANAWLTIFYFLFQALLIRPSLVYYPYVEQKQRWVGYANVHTNAMFVYISMIKCVTI